jgi:voltage-gated potassium channel
MLIFLRIVGRLRSHHIATLLGLAGMSILIGAVLFAVTQHVSFWTALYWAVSTATTVGYGDVTPHNPAGRAVAVGLMLTAIPLFGAVFAVLAGMAALVQVRRLFAMEHGLPAGKYAVIYGMHSAVPKILDELAKVGRSVVLVADVDPASVPSGIRLIAGDPTNEAIIRKSHPERAQEALVAGADDGDVLVTCVALRTLAPNLPISALTQSPKVAQALRELGVPRTLSGDDLVGHTLAKSLETPHAAELLLRLVDSDTYRIEEVPVDAAAVSRRLSEIRGQPRVLVLGLVHDEQVTLGIEDDPVIDRDDRLLILSLPHGKGS